MAMRKKRTARKAARKSAPKPAARTTKKKITLRPMVSDSQAKTMAAKTLGASAPAKRAATTQAAAAEPAGAATIVYIHGIGNKPLASVLKRQWDQALYSFDLGERSRMAYWVDRDRYPLPLEGDASGGDFADGTEDAPSGEVGPRAARAPWNPSAELSRMQDHLAELVGSPNEPIVPVSDAARLQSLAAKMLGDTALTNDAAYEENLAELRGPKGNDMRRIQAQRYGAVAVQAKVFGFLPRPLRQWLTRNVTRMFLRDVNDLFVDKPKGDRMKQALRDRLRAKGGPFVVISHSQGTMIAYTVLMEPEFADLDVRLFVTLGSPLGITEVQDFIKDLTGKKKLVVPPNVRRWINVCDPLDPVSLDKRLAADYGANSRGVKVDDFVKFNPDSPRHPHSGTGYLSMEQVRQPVRDSVDTALFQPVARFKIAKDVVRALSDSAADERHRILVQLEEFATTELTRTTALARIYDMLGASDESSETRKALEPEELHRYVALSLTRQQAETLSSAAHSDKKFPVARIWKNSAKRALLDRSIHTTQAFPAHTGYQAAGADITWAVLDSGIHLTHPHFSSGTIVRVFDCTNQAQRRSGARLTPLDLATQAGTNAAHDQFGHGAHVAGIIAGTHSTTMRRASRA